MFINLHLQKLKTKINPDTDNVPHTNRSSIAARFLNGDASDLSVRSSAAIVYLNSCPSDPTAKRTFKHDFLLLAGYDTPDDVPDEVATTIAEACVQEHSCQSLDRQRELEAATTSSLPTVSVISHGLLSDLVRDDYITPVDR